VFCPNCGAQNSDVATTCQKCGFNLKGSAAPKFKGTMLMMNAAGQEQPGQPGAQPQAPASGGEASSLKPKLKGTMIGVAPPSAGGVAPPGGHHAAPADPYAAPPQGMGYAPQQHGATPQHGAPGYGGAPHGGPQGTPQHGAPGYGGAPHGGPQGTPQHGAPQPTARVTARLQA
jgi:hypothetical protein